MAVIETIPSAVFLNGNHRFGEGSPTLSDLYGLFSDLFTSFSLSENNTAIQPTVLLPSVDELAELLQCSALDIIDTLEALRRNGYDYEINQATELVKILCLA